VPIVTEEPLEYLECEQSIPDGLGKQIMAKEEVPVECGEGEELLMDNAKLEIWERTSTYLQFDNIAKPF
jgi:hypothetical protein